MVWFQLVWKLLVIFHRTTASSAGFSLHYYHFLFWSFWLRQLPTGVCVCVCFLLIFFLTSNYLKQTNINKYILKSTHQLPKKKKKTSWSCWFFWGWTQVSWEGADVDLHRGHVFFWMWNELARAMAMFFDLNVWKGMVQLSPINGRLWTCVCVCRFFFCFCFEFWFWEWWRKTRPTLGTFWNHDGSTYITPMWGVIFWSPQNPQYHCLVICGFIQ